MDLEGRMSRTERRLDATLKIVQTGMKMLVKMQQDTREFKKEMRELEKEMRELKNEMRDLKTETQEAHQRLDRRADAHGRQAGPVGGRFLPDSLQRAQELNETAASKLAIALVTLAGAASAQSPALQDAQSALDRKDYASALRTVRPLAQAGDPAAQTLLGGMYVFGYGVSKSYAEAVNWYRKSAAQGFAEAQYQLGTALLLGQGTPRNDTEALNWLRKAAERGIPTQSPIWG